MVKSFSLQDYELQQHKALEEERLRLYAQIGALTLDLEAARAGRGELDARTRTFIGGVAARNKLSNYRWVRIEQDQLIADIMDAPPIPGPSLVRPPDPLDAMTQVNGPPTPAEITGAKNAKDKH